MTLENLLILANSDGFACGVSGGYQEQNPYNILLEEPLFDSWRLGWFRGIDEMPPPIRDASVQSNLPDLLNRVWRKKCLNDRIEANRVQATRLSSTITTSHDESLSGQRASSSSPIAPLVGSGAVTPIKKAMEKSNTEARNTEPSEFPTRPSSALLQPETKSTISVSGAADVSTLGTSNRLTQ